MQQPAANDVVPSEKPVSVTQPPRTWGGKTGHFFREHVRPILVVVLVLLCVRSSIADWNDVPTGSMKPSILEGDRIFVNKLAYDLKVPFTTWHIAQWDDPKRGDVVVFYAPPDGTRMVKRVIAVPGDIVGLVDNHLVVNGKAADYGPLSMDVVNQIPKPQQPRHGFNTEMIDGYSHPVMSTPGIPAQKRSFGPFTVPPGTYFMMGDNRDNSRDSRWWGVVDRNQILGKALGVVISLDPDRTFTPRWDRSFESLP